MTSIFSSFPRTRAFQLPIVALLAAMLFGIPNLAYLGGDGRNKISGA